MEDHGAGGVVSWCVVVDILRVAIEDRTGRVGSWAVRRWSRGMNAMMIKCITIEGSS